MTDAPSAILFVNILGHTITHVGATIMMYQKVYKLNANYEFQSHLKVDFNIVARTACWKHIAQLHNYRL